MGTEPALEKTTRKVNSKRLTYGIGAPQEAKSPSWITSVEGGFRETKGINGKK